MERLLKLVLVFGLLLPQVALAVPDAVNKSEAKQIAPEARPKDRKAVAARLGGVKLRACQRREARINTALDEVVSNSKRRLENIDRFINKTKDFYSQKQLSVADYSSRLAGLTEARVAAVKSIEAITQLGDFDCEGENPRNYLVKVRELRVAKHAAMKSYRQKAIDFMQAVKQARAQSKTNSSTNEVIE